MKHIIVRGILKKNTRGRCYLVYRNQIRKNKIIRLIGEIDLPGGQYVTVSGRMSGKSLQVEQMKPYYYPRRKAV